MANYGDLPQILPQSKPASVGFGKDNFGNLMFDNGSSIQNLTVGNGGPNVIASNTPCINIRFPYSDILNGTYSFVPTANPSATKDAAPTPVRALVDSDVTLPAQVGDVIELYLNLNINTNNIAAALNLSMWSIAGSKMREWSTGTLGLQPVTPQANMQLPANGRMYNNSPQNAITIKIINTVVASDIDYNGNVSFRLYGANAHGLTAAYTYNVLNNRASGTPNYIIGKNLRQNDPGITKLPSKVFKYPGGAKGTDVNFTTAATVFNGPIVKVDASGSLDYINSANIGDFIEADFQVVIATNNQICFIVLSVGGSTIRQWGAFGGDITTNNLSSWQGNLGAGDVCVNYANTVFNFKAINRVEPSDIGTDGNVHLVLYAFNSNSTNANWTLKGEYNSDITNLSYGQFTQWTTEMPYIISDISTVLNEFPQEPSPYIDNNGMINIIYDYGGVGSKGVCWAQANNPLGPYTIMATNITGNPADHCNGVYYENGILYLFFPNVAKGGNTQGINCWMGSDPLHLTWQSALALDSTANNPQGHNINANAGIVTGTLANTAICKGPGGLYYMVWEAQKTGASWQLGTAIATNPQGPYQYIDGSFGVATSLIAGNNTNFSGPWIEWTGEYFRMFYHSSNSPSGASTPNQVYCAYSLDCINWQPVTKNFLGQLSPALNTLFTEWFGGSSSTGDAAFLKYNNQIYLFTSEYKQGGAAGLFGGITVNNPAIKPISVADINLSVITDNDQLSGTLTMTSGTPITNNTTGIMVLYFFTLTDTGPAASIERAGVNYTVPLYVNPIILSPGDSYIRTFTGTAPTYVVDNISY